MYPNRKPAREGDDSVVLTPTESRQASPRRMNFRVLIISLVIMFAVGLALTVAFWGTAEEEGGNRPGNAPAAQSTVPPSSGGSSGQSAPAPASSQP